MLGVCERTFLRYVCRYEDAGLPGLEDKRVAQVSHRKANVVEISEVRELYSSHHHGWTVQHFLSWYRRTDDVTFCV